MTAASIVESVIPLTLGAERLPISFSLHGDRSGEILVEPVIAVLLSCVDGPRLLDTGINTVLIRDRWLYARLHGRNHDIVPLLPDGVDEPLLAELAAHGVAPEDLVEVYLSHLHNDHAGGLRLLPPGIPIHVQRAELDYGLRDHPFPERHGMFRVDYDDPELAWRLLDGDTELVPGVRALVSAGHTPGHQSFAVRTRAGDGYLFAFDAADLQRNIDEETGPGGFVHCSADVPLASLRRLKEIAAREDLRLLPGHDPEVWPAFTAELLGPG
ncbi:MAG TPA: N-acyl homoserine lactonase family protein [Solirubrobacteraceae bacterium]|jgi:glyoxylase-like metal-dependent hydrolase (beta-lactamase superfamily II)|nr:N-acyl homoserine lactonase family protein [Solirubrobacteraceae bacterium]